MANQSKSGSRKLFILIAVAVVGLGALLYFKRDTLGETWDVLLEANLAFVAALPLLQLLNYFFIGSYYRKMFAVFGAKISTSRSWGCLLYTSPSPRD